MKAKVYVETSVISYLTSRPNRDVVIAGRQQTTRYSWENRREALTQIKILYKVGYVQIKA
jgi:menaquinone-dependent protoporphyrinogen IX oxidase